MKEDRLGEAAMFLLPSLKLKERRVEEELHWMGPDGRESYGEHRQFLVAIDESKRRTLIGFLARMARELDEESILLQTGGGVSVVWA